MSHHSNRLLLATVIVCLTCGTHRALAGDVRPGFAMRLLTNGSIDSSFHDGLYGFDWVSAAAVDGENRVVIAGTREGKFAVTRLLPSGTLDLQFGINGMADKGFAAAAEARAVAIDPSGRIIVAGDAAQQFALACFTTDGDDCVDFGSDSKVTTAFFYSAEASAIAIASDGRIVVGGRLWNSFAGGAMEWFLLTRYHAIGTLDTSFGSGGIRTYNGGYATYPSMNHESINGLAIDTSGRIVAAGTFSAPNVDSRFALLRFHADGSTDTTFGPNANGMVTAFGGCSQMLCAKEAFATSVALQPDGKIVVAGGVRLTSSAAQDFDVALARFLPSGSLDTGFGLLGYVRTPLAGYDEARAVKVAGGSLFVAGHSDGQPIVARYSLSNGFLVSDFDGGVAEPPTTCPGPVPMGPANALAVQSFPCRGLDPFCAPIRKPVIVGTCF